MLNCSEEILVRIEFDFLQEPKFALLYDRRETSDDD